MKSTKERVMQIIASGKTGSSDETVARGLIALAQDDSISPFCGLMKTIGECDPSLVTVNPKVCELLAMEMKRRCEESSLVSDRRSAILVGMMDDEADW